MKMAIKKCRALVELLGGVGNKSHDVREIQESLGLPCQEMFSIDGDLHMP